MEGDRKYLWEGSTSTQDVQGRPHWVKCHLGKDLKQDVNVWAFQ